MLNGNNLINFFWNFLLDAIYPKKCRQCGAFGFYLCEKCVNGLKLKKEIQCSVCENNLGQCRCQSSLDGLFVIGDYHQDLLQKIVKEIKYGFYFKLGESYFLLLGKYFLQNQGWIKEAVIVPVPLHRKRFLWRGFNQAELIGREINKVVGNLVDTNLLFRIRFNEPQANLSAEARKNNVRGVFAVNLNNELNKNHPIILVDDVYTTGSTMLECARVLREAGFKKVFGLVIAREGKKY